MRHGQRYVQRTPKPRPAGYQGPRFVPEQPAAARSAPFTRAPRQTGGGAPTPKFKPKNRRHWKDAMRRSYGLLGDALGMKVAQLRPMPMADIEKLTKANPAKAGPLFRRLKRILALEPKPQVQP